MFSNICDTCIRSTIESKTGRGGRRRCDIGISGRLFIGDLLTIITIQIVTGVFFGIAITIALARIIIRLHINKHFGLDDWLLVLACVCLTAGTGLLLYSIPTVYLIEETSLNPLGLFGNGGSGITDLNTLLIKVNYFAKFNWIYLILSWTTIFSVKFGFLVFFKQLVRGLPEMYRYWKVVVAITAVVYAFALVDGVIACPKDGLNSCMVLLTSSCHKSAWLKS